MLRKTFPSYATWLDRTWFYAYTTLCVLVLLFLLLPELTIIPLSFNQDTFLIYPIKEFSLRWYAEFFQSDVWMRATKNTFIIAPAATLIATVLGTLAAAGMTLYEFKGKGIITAILISPMIVPLVVTGLGIYLFFAPYGLVNSYVSIIIAHAALGTPFVFITVLATMQGFDKNLTKAGYSLGAGRLRTFFDITLPIIAPGVISGAVFAFATSFDEIVVVLFLAGPEQVTLPRQMFNGVRENINPTIAVVATILMVFSTTLLLTLLWLRARAKRRTGT
ncbi:ABC transporter permease [Castellaniella sp.]|uniref:ABC transporter permease n=1 Tax=Castellaniella sp. TaxID=1955812 RepID=UPI003561ECF8